MLRTLMDPDHSFLLVIDIQERMFSSIGFKGQRAIEKYVPRLIKAAKALGIPIVVTEQYPKGLGGTLPDMKRLLEDANARFFEKNSFSVLRDDSIRKHIKSLNRDECVVCGIETHVCVYQSVVDLINENFDVRVPRECVASRSKKNWEVGISAMAHVGAQISSVEMVLFEWLGTAANPAFKQVQSLIK